VANAASDPTSGSKLGKNILLKTNAVAVAYSVKSYYSMVLPIALASATLTILALPSTAPLSVS
jgi:hypothetical protein